MNKADLYKAYKVLDFSHKKIEMELNDMKDEIQYAEKIADSKKSSWETNKRLLKENTQLKEELKRSQHAEEELWEERGALKEEIHKLKWKISEDNGTLNRAEERYKKLMITLKENRGLKEENEKLKEKHEKFRVRNCDRMEELVKALSPWKKNHEDHKRILEAIVELKEEHQKLLDDIELHPDYQETIKSTIEEFIKSMKEKIDEESDDESNPPCVTCGGCHGRFVDGESYCDDWDCVNSDDEEVSFCGVNGHRCEECTDCARSKVCDTCKCVGGCYEDCLSNS